MLRLKSNEEIDNEKVGTAKDPETPQWVVTGLAGHVHKQWQAAKTLKNPIDIRNKKSERARNGVYDPDKLAAIRAANSSEIFINVTATKCRAAEAWIDDIERNIHETMWTIKPRPIPELPPEMERKIIAESAQMAVSEHGQIAEATGGMMDPGAVMSQVQAQVDDVKAKVKNDLLKDANGRSEKMGDLIENQLLNGGFYPALKSVTRDIIGACSGILKGPIFRKKPVEKWVQKGKLWFSVVDPKIVPEFERTSPHDFYPLGRSLDEDVIEKHSLTRTALNECIGVDGYNDEAIKEVLDNFSTKGFREWTSIDFSRDEVSDPAAGLLQDFGTIDALQYWGSVSSKLIREWGNKDLKEENDHEEIQIEAWLVGPTVIKAILNPHPLGKKPYNITSFEKVQDSLWGKSIPEVIADIQSMCNAAARAMINNMAMSSQPQVEVNIDRVPVGTNIQAIWSGRVWPSTSKQMTEGPAVKFFQPETIIEELMALYDKFSRMADEHSNVPAYAHGSSQVGGAGNTSSGLAQLRSDAAKGINAIYTNRDDEVIAPVIYEMYRYNMQYEKDDSVKGDLQVVVKGADSIIAKEQQIIRINEFLVATNNPVDIAIVGMGGRARLLRRTIKNLGIDDANDILGEDKIAQFEGIQAPMMPGQPTPGVPGVPGAPGGPGELPRQQGQLPGGMIAGGPEQDASRQQHQPISQ